MANYSLNRYLMMTLDPVHIGTGGYRLGRVDLSIAREPGTNVPKIPGTSLSGALRQYAAYRYGKVRCAGKGDAGDESKKHCGQPTCPICYTFGYAKGEDGGYSGTVSIFDAQIFLFPVHSMAGPIWVSTKERLEAYKFQISGAPSKDEEVAIVAELPKKDGKENKPNWWNNSALNLGWLMLDVKTSGAIAAYPENSAFGNDQAWETVANRLVIVTEKVFSQVVNSNLEVRTSVSINPLTGAAEEGALFTYEAIPRATWLIMDIVIDDYRIDDNKRGFPNMPTLQIWQLTLNNGNPEDKKKLLKKWGLASEGNNYDQDLKKAQKWISDDLNLYNKIKNPWSTLDGLVLDSLNMASFLGIGGMGTRGFGRIRTLSSWEVDHESH